MKKVMLLTATAILMSACNSDIGGVKHPKERVVELFILLDKWVLCNEVITNNYS